MKWIEHTLHVWSCHCQLLPQIGEDAFRLLSDLFQNILRQQCHACLQLKRGAIDAIAPTVEHQKGLIIVFGAGNEHPDMQLCSG